MLCQWRAPLSLVPPPIGGEAPGHRRDEGRHPQGHPSWQGGGEGGGTRGAGVMAGWQLGTAGGDVWRVRRQVRARDFRHTVPLYKSAHPPGDAGTAPVCSCQPHRHPRGHLRTRPTGIARCHPQPKTGRPRSRTHRCGKTCPHRPHPRPRPPHPTTSWTPYPPQEAVMEGNASRDAPRAPLAVERMTPTRPCNTATRGNAELRVAKIKK